jgi:hypothetical protein
VQSMKSDWRFGVLGTIQAVPASYHVETVIVVGQQGVNRAMRDWGDLLLTR